MAKTKSSKKKQIEADELLVTQHGFEELRDELENRFRLRDEIAKEIEEARDLGDLSENASYQEAMERKELNERRISELEDLISRAVVVQETVNDKVVTIGRKVEIQNLSSKKKRVVHIVGATEADPLKNRISNDSPLGRALVNSRLGETVQVVLPSQEIEYKIIEFSDDKAA